MNKIRALALGGLLAIVTTIAAASPAAAHDTCVAHGEDVACVRNFHTVIDACDRESDGHRVRAHWRTASGSIGIGDWDPNGANSGCAHNSLPGAAIQFRICEEVVGCSAWANK